ncbi:hypothetical protein G7Y89_g1974 [Cudoniella acicularis]|uniref:FAD-binding PCMH-type domain-containing protein n=1 Tax=Cudoniella acicularis TaxID=354080 RepID=A0A8H4RV16_9HELO|nr:hypothetical protein G7Y89_g1974 [Cudoniella acicularis]
MLRGITGGVLALSTLLSNALGHSAAFEPRQNGSTSTAQGTGNVPCDALIKAGLGDRLLVATNNDYEPQIQTWWALNSRLRPWCLVLPHTTEEVSQVLTALVNAGSGAGDWHIAVRSGGHSLEGINNVANGVTIDLSYLNQSIYNNHTNLASIGPGARWRDVYANLLQQGVVVTGGRDGGVGVGGFLLGGGLSYYTGHMGLGCDSVINYEVVLANGQIVNANSDENSDLWKALKGGSSNFGIVTRFDMEAMPARNISYGIRVMGSEYSDAMVDALVSFTNHMEMAPDDALFMFYGHNTTETSGITMTTVSVNTVGNMNSSSFDKINKIPAISSFIAPMTLAAAAAGSQLPAGNLATGYTIAFKNDPAILRQCVHLHEELVNTLTNSIGAENFITLNFFQPFPAFIGKIGLQRGGNMLGFDRENDNAILWTGSIALNSTQEDLAVAHQQLGAMASQVQEFARSVSGDVDLIYLNYADVSQDPIGSYGAENIQHIREVAAKYDATNVFQKRIPGGFKISRVD